MREISAEELVTAVEDGSPLHVLDVRPTAQLANGRVDLVAGERYHCLVGSELMALSDPREVGLDPAFPIAVVCARGIASRDAASFLSRRGYDAVSLHGGFGAWMMATMRRELPPPPGFDRLLQFDRVGKGALSYLLVSDGQALAVDPSRNLEPFLEELADTGARLIGVADTHVHADYISGAATLATMFGVPYLLNPCDAVYPYDGRVGTTLFSPILEGDIIRVGRGSVRVEHNPGHTEGSVTFVVGSTAALTGDFIFVRSVGRPDLAGKTKEWTRALFASLERARTEWAPDMLVYPAHYSSPAERLPDHSIGAPFARLLADNEPLAIRDADAFSDWVASRCSPFPDAYRRIKAINIGLQTAAEATADELEFGRNQCALA